MAKLNRSVGLLALAAALAACGGGDGGSAAPPPVGASPPPPPPPAATGMTVSSGAVTGFSSIVVDGTPIETTPETVFAIEGEDERVGDQSVIELGMVVAATSTTDDDGALTAVRFEVDDGILGVVENISPDPDRPELGSVVVAGQTILIDGNTVFDDDIPDADGVSGVDIRDLAPAVSPGGLGLVIEVSGFPTEFGAIATRIDREDDIDPATIGTPGVEDDEVQVVGFVDSVDPLGAFFSINAATFTVNAATELDDGIVVDDTLVGAFVEVEADLDAADDLIAVEVENESDLDDLFDDAFDEDDDFDIEGLLQSVDLGPDPDVIVINGVEIPVADASQLVDRVGQIVDIEGSFNADGVFVLSEIEVERENSIETEDVIAEVDAADGTITTRLGLTITPTGASRLEIDSDAFDDDSLTPEDFLAAVNVGDFVEARGFPAEGGVVWTRIEVEDDEDDQACSLQGPVDSGSISDPTFAILGVTIDTAGLDNDDFEDENDAPIGRAAFFAALSAGVIVDAESDDAGLGCEAGLLRTFDEGEVSFEEDDAIAGNAPDDEGDGINTLELEGAVSALDPVANTFLVAGLLVTVTDDTRIDDSIVEAARGGDLDNEAGFPFGDLPETLDELLENGDPVQVLINGDGVAIEIEDNTD